VCNKKIKAGAAKGTKGEKRRRKGGDWKKGKGGGKRKRKGREGEGENDEKEVRAKNSIKSGIK